MRKTSRELNNHLPHPYRNVLFFSRRVKCVLYALRAKNSLRILRSSPSARVTIICDLRHTFLLLPRCIIYYIIVGRSVHFTPGGSKVYTLHSAEIKCLYTRRVQSPSLRLREQRPSLRPAGVKRLFTPSGSKVALYAWRE